LEWLDNGYRPRDPFRTQPRAAHCFLSRAAIEIRIGEQPCRLALCFRSGDFGFIKFEFRILSERVGDEGVKRRRTAIRRSSFSRDRSYDRASEHGQQDQFARRASFHKRTRMDQGNWKQTFAICRNTATFENVPRGTI